MVGSSTKLKPEISVVMSVRNGEKHLSEAVDSILIQSFEKFEFIIVNDGSTDNTAGILRDYSNKDARIEIIELAASGLPVALNTALKRASAPFVARMDADDISLPQRFSKQIEYLKRHEEIAAVGSYAIIIDEEGRKQNVSKMPTTVNQVRKTLPHKCCLINPSAMIRRKTLMDLGGYNAKYVVAEDYDLWLRVFEVSNLANLAEPLIMHRKHKNQTTKSSSINTTMYRVSAVLDHFFRKYNSSTDVHQIQCKNDGHIAKRILSLYELRPRQEDMRAINATAIRFFRKASLDRQISAKLDAAILKSSNIGERFKHRLYKAGL